MPGRASFPDNARDVLAELLREAKTKADFQRVQAVWLRVLLDLPYDQIALAVGLSENTVRCLCSRFRTQGPEALRAGPGRGGRRNAHLSVAEEEAFLRPFFEQAARGGILHVGEIKAAYEKRVGRQVPKSTVYRLLARHGWRKLAPRHRHPKADLRAQEAFKKNSAASSKTKWRAKGNKGDPCD